MAHLHGLDRQSEPAPPLVKHHRRPLPAFSEVVLPILALMAIGMACGFCPQIHQLIQRTFTQIQTGQMTVGMSLVTIGVPAVAGTLLITSLFLLIREHHRREQNSNFDLDEDPYSITATIKRSVYASPKTWKAIAATLGALAIAGLSVWCVAPCFQPLQNFLQHSIPIWKGLAYVGGGSVGGTLIMIAAAAALRKLQELHRASQIKHYQNCPYFDCDT